MTNVRQIIGKIGWWIGVVIHAAGAVPLENWRAPLYRIAVEQGEIAGSPSRMFWDDMGSASIMNPDLWPDSSRYARNHWTIEPALRSVVSNDRFITGKKSNLHFDVLSNFKYKNLTVRTVLDVDQSYPSDPSYVWKKDRIAAGLIEEAYMQYTGSHGFARLGRMKRNWGPFFDRSILLSNNAFAYDAFEWQFTVPFLEFRHLFSAFPRHFSFIDTKHERQDRYFSAHALNFIFGKWAAIGVSETVLFSRESGLPDLQYVNPFSVYSVTNTNYEGSANLMLGFHGWVHPFTDKITVKGQVVFDDFQVDDDSPGDQEPMHWACDAGVYWVDPLPLPLNHTISVEYRYLSKWMYTVTPTNTRRGERYTYIGKSLGYPDIDGDFFRGAVNVVGKNFWTATLGMSVARQDTCTIDTPWPNDPPGYTTEDPLSQRTHLKTTLTLFAEALGYFKNFCTVSLGLENRWVKDNAATGAYTYEPRVSLAVSLHYSDFFLLFNREE